LWNCPSEMYFGFIRGEMSADKRPAWAVSFSRRFHGGRSLRVKRSRGLRLMGRLRQFGVAVSVGHVADAEWLTHRCGQPICWPRHVIAHRLGLTGCSWWQGSRPWGRQRRAALLACQWRLSNALRHSHVFVSAHKRLHQYLTASFGFISSWAGRNE